MPACTCANFCAGPLGGGCNADGTPTVPSVCNAILATAQATGLCSGGANVACTTTHRVSSNVQGAGLCCQAVQSGLLTPPPKGTTLPVYTPGSASTLPAGRITVVTDAAGHCASCMIVGSASKKHPGRPVLKFIRGGPSCPSATGGCCALAA